MRLVLGNVISPLGVESLSMGPRETAQLVTYSSCKPEDLNVILRVHVKLLSLALSISHARTGEENPTPGIH